MPKMPLLAQRYFNFDEELRQAEGSGFRGTPIALFEDVETENGDESESTDVEIFLGQPFLPLPNSPILENYARDLDTEFSVAATEHNSAHTPSPRLPVPNEMGLVTLTIIQVLSLILGGIHMERDLEARLVDIGDDEQYDFIDSFSNLEGIATYTLTTEMLTAMAEEAEEDIAIARLLLENRYADFTQVRAPRTCPRWDFMLDFVQHHGITSRSTFACPLCEFGLGCRYWSINTTCYAWLEGLGYNVE